MSSYKERWFADFERRLGDYEDAGMDYDHASEAAAEDAYDALADSESALDRFDTLTSEDIETLAEEAAWKRDRE